jgi:geranylgeranyl diphosphate synthase type I
MSKIDLKEKLAQINELVEPAITELLIKDVEQNNIPAILHQCEAGGKRIRPALIALSGQLFGADIHDLVYPAAAAEILHNATLIIDDIIDHSEFRRNEPTCWNKYGQSMAECASMDYLASVFEGVNRANNSSRLVNLYSKTLKIIVDGEIKDILFERSGRDNEQFVVDNRYKTITKDDYLSMIGQKTAILLQMCCTTGAICANATEEQIATISEYGWNLGMAFQIRDDILDIFGDEKSFGKKIGKDIIEKKMGNFVILSAIEQLESDDKMLILNLLEGTNEVTDEDVKIVTALIEKTNAKKTADDLAVFYIQKAFDDLSKLPQNEFNETLVEIANYIVNRSK